MIFYSNHWILLTCFYCLFKLNIALIEPGFQKYIVELGTNDSKKNVSFSKSMFKDTEISFRITCKGKMTSNFTLGIALVMSQCHFNKSDENYNEMSISLPCHENVIVEKDFLSQIIFGSQNNDSGSNQISRSDGKQRKKFNINKLPKTQIKGLYSLLLFFQQGDEIKTENKGEDMTFEVTISAMHDDSYLSSMNWPLLPFYGAMSLMYLTFAITWFIASCCNWRDLLRVQFWIGAVVAIGMLENALFYTEYRNISTYGETNGLLYFAELVSCIKRTLARILVIIVSLGFGIVKPRLGQMFNRVLIIGFLYMVLSTVEAFIRVHDDSKVVSKTQMYALIPLTIIDVIICWWVFTSLVQTTRTLRIRKNTVKLTLYRHFTNTLIFAVLASLAYMVWMIKQAKLTECVDIGSIWLSEALWPFLFGVILAVIMILWRPSINNQRYAFTPLDLDGSDDEDDDMTLSDAFSGMKNRSKDTSGVKNRNRAEDDLKWVEENIPSVPSTLLPTIDSDEEILTTKFEMSKMN
ncbi:transmembrane protein 87B isoform X3 [Hydra vulgaris]|uniref:Transmembrane protein 87B isoform X3 n=1 Tax=Hydra vulgaris TaxID=6087 RepID=A0ABM4C132_HYDVU